MSFWSRSCSSKRCGRGIIVLLLVLVMTGGLQSVVWAEPTVIIDSVQETTAVTDGTVDPTEYSGYSVGINAGGGNIIGRDSKIYVDSGGTEETVHFGLVPAEDANFSTYVIIYIDSVDGGFSSTEPLEDDADYYRAAVSAYISGRSINLEFAPDFAADYAVAVSAQNGYLFQLKDGGDNSLTELSPVNLQPVGDSSAGAFEFYFPMSDVGLSEGGSFKYVATSMHYTVTARYNEFHGVRQTTYDENWPGGSSTSEDFALQQGDFNEFYTTEPSRVGFANTEASSVRSGNTFLLWPLLLAVLTVPLLLRRLR